MDVVDFVVKYLPYFIVPFILSYGLTTLLGNYMVRRTKNRYIDFDDYKEKELGDIGIFKDEAEFNDYKEL